MVTVIDYIYTLTLNQTKLYSAFRAYVVFLYILQYRFGKTICYHSTEHTYLQGPTNFEITLDSLKIKMLWECSTVGSAVTSRLWNFSASQLPRPRKWWLDIIGHYLMTESMRPPDDDDPTLRYWLREQGSGEDTQLPRRSTTGTAAGSARSQSRAY